MQFKNLKFKTKQFGDKSENFQELLESESTFGYP
jgi:hypothetical protein